MRRHDAINRDADAVTDQGGLQPGAGDPARPRRSTRRRIWLRVAAILAVFTLAFAATGSTGFLPVSAPGTTSSGQNFPTAGATGQPSQATPTAGEPTRIPTPAVPGSRGYLADRSDLIQRAVQARTGSEPYARALDDLLAWARHAVRGDPRPSARLRISGTKGPFVDDTATAYGLALANATTGERRYGEAAAHYIMAWVDKTTTTVDTCKRDGACQTSLIISRTVPGFVFAADLLAGTGYLDDAETERFRTWLRDVILPTASELDNNWGDAGTFTRITLTDYLDDRKGFDAAIAKWRQLMDLVKADGHIPLEVARGVGGLGYTQEALDYKVAAAVIAERRGVDLWSYVGAGGASLKDAIDYLAKYMAHPDRWPWYDGVKRWSPSPFWELAYSHWQDPAFGKLVRERRPQGNIGHSALRWTTLTNGIPVTSG